METSPKVMTGELVASGHPLTPAEHGDAEDNAGAGKNSEAQRVVDRRIQARRDTPEVSTVNTGNHQHARICHPCFFFKSWTCIICVKFRPAGQHASIKETLTVHPLQACKLGVGETIWFV